MNHIEEFDGQLSGALAGRARIVKTGVVFFWGRVV